MTRLTVLTLALALAPAAAAAEKPPVFVEGRAVKDKPAAFAPDPARAYVMIRGGKSGASFLFMKDPSAEDQAAYDRMKAEAFEKERNRYVKRVAAYKRDFAAWEQSRNAVGPRPEKPEKPVEPTEENFDFTPFELMAQVFVGPINRYAKGEESIYLHELTPGSYRLYGPIFAGQQGAVAGICYCLGSVRFTAQAGAITDLGKAIPLDPVKPADGDSSSPLTTAAMAYRLEPVTAQMAVDARLKGATIRPAEYRAAGKLPNYFGLAIDRLAPVPGVLDYERDRIIDLKSTTASTSSR